MQGTWVQSLTQEQRSQMPQATKSAHCDYWARWAHMLYSSCATAREEPWAATEIWHSQINETVLMPILSSLWLKRKLSFLFNGLTLLFPKPARYFHEKVSWAVTKTKQQYATWLEMKIISNKTFHPKLLTFSPHPYFGVWLLFAKFWGTYFDSSWFNIYSASINTIICCKLCAKHSTCI